MFAQDRWRVGSRVTFELGLRARSRRGRRARELVAARRRGDRRAARGPGASCAAATASSCSGRRSTSRPFPSFEPRTVSRFAVDGSPLGAADHVRQRHRRPICDTPRSARRQRRVEPAVRPPSLCSSWRFCRRQGSHEYIVTPDPDAGELRLSSSGHSRYRELEATTRYLGGERRDLTLSYVWARGDGRSQQLRSVLRQLPQPDRPRQREQPDSDRRRHRLLLRGTIGLPWQVGLRAGAGAPIGVPVVGGGRVPGLRRSAQPRRTPAPGADAGLLARAAVAVSRYRFRAGISVYNVFGASAERDIQANVTSPFYGTFYNPIERSIGFVFGTVK